MLFHVSEVSGIERFVPRSSPYTDEPVVRAIDADHLRNHLLPRECPHVTYDTGPETTAADVERCPGCAQPLGRAGWSPRRPAAGIIGAGRGGPLRRAGSVDRSRTPGRAWPA
jgi:hypothetical protein